MQYQVGDSIGDYIVQGHLGSGASGDVYRVEHTITKRVEAMKVLPGPIEDERAERILREAKMQARLNHPNITALHNAFWWNSGLVLVMELVDGESLRTRLERDSLTLDLGVHFARQILLALAHAHQNGVVHRDISPANILITRKGRIKLTDFGLAKDPSERKITRTGALMGSIYYSAPEQIRCSAEVDHRADLYSCGAVMYEMFTSRKPFESENSFELMMAHAQTIPMHPTALNSALPDWLDDLLLRALEKDPDRRFHSAAEFLKALDGEHAHGRPPVVYAAATFAMVSLLFGAITLFRWSSAEIPLGPPMPSVAIQVPPIEPPPLVLAPAAQEEPAMVAPSSPAPRTVAAKRTPQPQTPPAQPQTAQLRAKIVGQEPLAVTAPPPAVDEPAPASPEIEAEVASVPARPAPTPQPSPVPKQPAPLTAAAPEQQQGPGLIRGFVHRINPFRRGRKPISPASPQAIR